MNESKIIVLDFGSQYNQLIVRRIREMGVYSELLPNDISLDTIKNDKNIVGIVFSGSPKSVHDVDAFDIDDEIFKLGLPILGICYGMQLTCKKLGGSVVKSNTREYGKMDINIKTDSLLFDGLSKKETVWMSHGDHVEELPDGFKVDAISESGVISSISDKKNNIYCVQFHPEVVNSVHGFDMLKNFVFKVCDIKVRWTMKSFIEEETLRIREVVKDKRVLLGLSGGVDSTVCAVLMNKAIGEQLTCMFIDHGLLRKNEGDEVVNTCNKFGIKLVRINAKDRFLKKLEGVSEPEKKRKIIGNEFVYCFDEESKKIGDFDFLAQGTLYTDVIESGTKTAQTIKSHHNVGGLPKDMKFKLIEPLRVLFKDEVRALGKELGIADEIVWRQPFPGPGLAIRIIGDITEEKIRMVQDADYILRTEIKNHGLDKSIWQYFCALTNMKSVGVMGDERTYNYAIAIRAVTSKDGMTADWARVPYDVLDIISRRIVNEVKGINRVLYDCTSKPPATIEFE